MKTVLINKKERRDIEYPVNYTDMPLDYLKDEFPEVYKSIIRSRKFTDQYIYMTVM
jgi:hypothetical protein